MAEPLARADLGRYPYQMISRRRKATMNSWLGDTAGADMKPDLSDVVEIAAADGHAAGLNTGDRVMVRSRAGSLEANVLLSDKLRAEIEARGYDVKDNRDGATAYKKR